MTNDTSELARIQRWMQTVITHPDGIEGGMASPQAQQGVPLADMDVERVIARSQTQTSIERLRIYGNAYFARLIECLASEYPALRQAVGEEAFSGFVFGYVQQYPPDSYTLSDLGRRFPTYLRKSRPAPETPTPDWPDFLVDLALLERAYAEVFDGPGEEDEPPLSTSMLASVAEDLSGVVRLLTARSLRLIALRFPAHEYETAVRRRQEAIVPSPAPTWLAIHRHNFIVRRRSLSEFQYELLSRLICGLTLGESLQGALDATGQCPEDLTNLRSWFQSWTSAGYFRGIQLEPAQSSTK